VKDMSKTGFRLIAPMQAASGFPVGTLVAIRPHDESQWTLGIVRRMRRHTSERTEIGLQMVASTLAGVDLVEQRRSAETDYLVDGEEGIINGRSFIALFLTLKKRDETSVQSLIVPASEYHAGKRLTLVTAKSIYRVVLGGPIEQQPEWVWTAVEPQEIGAQVGVSSTSGAPPRSH
jgi:cyclic-di-GMP-binding protein